MINLSIENILSIFMVVASVATLLHLFYYRYEAQREKKAYTIDRLEDIFEKIEKFHEASYGIGEYTTETEDFYKKVVDPYLISLLILYVQVDSKLLDKKYLKPYIPFLTENYKRIKNYIDYQREPPNTPEAWEEITLLNNLLGIENK